MKISCAIDAKLVVMMPHELNQMLSMSLPDHSGILLVEDDQELASLVKEYLCKNGFSVDICSDGEVAARRIINEEPALVILDVMLPSMSGMDVCREVRTQYQGPILMLTALDEDVDQMLGLELGADDYVIKPIKPRLLLSRVKALLRRSTQGKGLSNGDLSGAALGSGHHSDLAKSPRLEIEKKTRTVLSNGAPVPLTTAEFDLLLLLAEHAGTIVSRDTILSHLRGFQYDGLDRSIDRRVSRLRRKLEDDPVDPRIIKTIRGKGYLLSAVIQA